MELAPGKLQNPINPGPGPFMVIHRVNYYLTTTQWDAIRIWKATTLAGLKTAPHVTVSQDADPSRSQGLWAPECHLIGNRWCLYYTATSSDNHYQPREIAGFRTLGAMPCRPGGLGNVLGGAGAANAVPPQPPGISRAPAFLLLLEDSLCLLPTAMLPIKWTVALMVCERYT